MRGEPGKFSSSVDELVDSSRVGVLDATRLGVMDVPKMWEALPRDKTSAFPGDSHS